MILHIVKRGEWDAAVARGSYAPASLRVEGFIHCSTPAQVIDTANRFYRGQSDLVVVLIEESKVKAEVRWEAPAERNSGRSDSTAEPSPARSGASSEPSPSAAEPSPNLSRKVTGEVPDELFPHLYGALNVDAVVRVVELVWQEDRGFRMVEGGGRKSHRLKPVPHR